MGSIVASVGADPVKNSYLKLVLSHPMPVISHPSDKAAFRFSNKIVEHRVGVRLRVL